MNAIKKIFNATLGLVMSYKDAQRSNRVNDAYFNHVINQLQHFQYTAHILLNKIEKILPLKVDLNNLYYDDENLEVDTYSKKIRKSRQEKNHQKKIILDRINYHHRQEIIEKSLDRKPAIPPVDLINFDVNDNHQLIEAKELVEYIEDWLNFMNFHRKPKNFFDLNESKKKRKLLMLDRPTSHGGWPKGKNRGWVGDRPVNDIIYDYLKSMGLIDDVPHGKLSESKIKKMIKKSLKGYLNE